MNQRQVLIGGLVLFALIAVFLVHKAIEPGTVNNSGDPYRRPATIPMCENCLKQIGVAISFYEDRFEAYPPGTGQEFFRALRKGVPDITQDHLFVCPVLGTKPGANVCDYRGPAVQLLKDMPDDTIVACDEPDNHRKDSGIHVLLFTGKVQTAQKGSPLYIRALKETVGKAGK